MNKMGESEYDADCTSDVDAAARPRRQFFKFEDNGNVNDFCFQRIVEENGQFRSIPIQICAFSELQNKHLVAIDKRGNIFVIELSNRSYFQHEIRLPKACALKGSVHVESKFLIGTRSGKLLYMDVDQPGALNAMIVSTKPILEMSFPGQPLQPSLLLLINTANAAIIINIEKFTVSYRLDFDDYNLSLKFACFLPHSKQLFTCFAGGTIFIWSGVTMTSENVVDPLKEREQILLTGVDSIPSVALPPNEAVASAPSASDLNASDDRVLWYCCKPDGSLLCLCTWDNYVLLISPGSFRISSMFRLKALTLQECAFMPHIKETLLLGLTTAGQVVLIDAAKEAVTVVVDSSQGLHIQVSGDGKFLAVLTPEGAAHIWSTAQLVNGAKEKYIAREKEMAVRGNQKGLTDHIKRVLTHDRLQAILKEYGTYPAKHRPLCWSALLQLPYNSIEFKALLRKKPMPMIGQRVAELGLKDKALERALLVLWNCLAHWCIVLAYSDFVPRFIHPFLKALPKKAAITVFEVCVSLFLNHCQLWFEINPLPPYNYLGICNNIQKHFDPPLSEFYHNKMTAADDFAFIVLSTAFSDVLKKEQWLQLWDHVLFNTPEFLVFCIVAFNIVLREEIMRLPDKSAIQGYFRQQRSIDMIELLNKAYELMRQCPAEHHPRRYMRVEYQPIPPGVYPEFLNYPEQLLTRYDLEVLEVQQEHREIDERLRKLELLLAKEGRPSSM